MEYNTLMTPCGEIKGIWDKENEINIYRGIRFATSNRFEFSKEVTEWDGIYDATNFGPASYQEGAFIQGNPEDFYNKEFYNGEKITYSEDCLFLNIWAPENTTNAPVLVYVHGGAFNHGYSYEKPFDGTNYCKKGVILVTVSYRLCAPGYLCLPEFADEDGHYGNYALHDLKTSLEWIKHNIKAFGGDPDNVTLSGQSAGAMSVSMLIMSPLTEGLFDKAYMMSGGGVSEHSHFTSTLNEQVNLSRKFMEKLGVSSAKELKTMDIKKLTLDFGEFCNELGQDIRFGIPTVDGYFIPDAPIKLAQKGLQKNIPYILGTTSEDILQELFVPMSEGWAKLAATQNKEDVYLYYFSRQLPGDDQGAWHSSDLWYFFGTLDKCWRPFTKWDYELSDRYMTYVANFAKMGKPGTDWEPYRISSKKMILGDPA